VVAIGRNPRRREEDLMIAAANRLPLFTTNPDDFRGAEGTVTLVAVP
jgi:hypothetical protein